MKKSPNSIDIHVGCRVRLLRRRLGVSQQKLADAVGVTFQQMQKYEKGINQIRSSRLHQIAKTLQVPPASLFEGVPRRSARRSTQATASPTRLFKFIATSDGLAMAKAFMRLDAKLRRRILDLVQAITDTDK
jgi:transcriptional regulator with XRE-family HTH domain